jgi:hypothetical protein
MNATQQIQQLQQKRLQLLEQLAALQHFRRGSISEQYVEVTSPKGTKRRRGPYPLYTYKETGKTVSRRLSDPDTVAVYRQQIDAFHQFQHLTAELLRLGEQLSDLAWLDPEALKKTSNSRSSSRPR